MPVFIDILSTDNIILSSNNDKEMLNEMSTRRVVTDEDRRRIVSSFLDRRSPVDIASVLGLLSTTIYGIIKVYEKENQIVGKKN